MADAKEAKEVHYSSGKSFYIRLRSDKLPFAVGKKGLKEAELANTILQKFVRLIEKRFDTIWYIGTDFIEDELYERFMFHHGGFMEISLSGEINCFFLENKLNAMKKAIYHAVRKMKGENIAKQTVREIKAGERLISLDASVLK